MFAAVALAQAALLGVLDLMTGPDVVERREPAPPTSYLPMTLPSKRTPAPQPQHRTPRRKRPEPAAGAPALAAAPPPTGSSPAASKPDYGRWTVNGSGNTASPGIRTALCDISNLASLPPDQQRACLNRVRAAAAQPAHEARPRDWTDRSSPLASCADAPPKRGLALTHCSEGLRLKYRF